MEIIYTQINYNDEIENKIFNFDRNKVDMIVLDSLNFVNGKTFESEDDKIKHFLNEQIKFGNKGLFYDYIITKTGKVYKCTPKNKCGTVLNFRYYSEEASILLPKYCDQTDGELFKRTKTPDQVVASICIESDESDPTVSINSGNINDFEKESLEDIIAYYIRENESIGIKKIVNRSCFPKDENLRRNIGHMYYKNNIVRLILEISLAARKAKNVSIENIEFSKINTIEL